MSIIKNRKKMLILLAALLPIALVMLAEAGDMIGGKTAYAPAFYSTNIFLVSIAIGLCAGLITGCIGAGGGFIITPALMAAGVKGILAVGTDLFHIFAKAIMGTTVHKKLGNVSVKLAIAFLVGSAGGTFIGGALNKALYDKDPLLSEAFISLVYAVLLGFLGFYALADFLKSRKSKDTGDAHGGSSGMTDLSRRVQDVKVPPQITFDEDYVPGGRKISGVIVALGGVVVGVMAAIMGVGGGFITFPPVRDLRVRVLYTGDGHAARLSYRHPGRCAHDQGGEGHPHPRFLRRVHHRRVHQPGSNASEENGGTRDDQHVPGRGEGNRDSRQYCFLGGGQYIRRLGDRKVYRQYRNAPR
jgi:uncharacterized membrane protein YfcA